MHKVSAIPTVYHGVRFRSRLEARWASFFDSQKWDWSYEPLDLKGYIPDFLVDFDCHDMHNTLVEVKPLISLNHGLQFCRKIERVWEGSAALVGTRWQLLLQGNPVPPHTLLDSDGLLQEAPEHKPATSGHSIQIGRMRLPRQPWSAAYLQGPEPCSVHYKPYEFNMLDSIKLQLAWCDAGNQTQWRGAK